MASSTIQRLTPITTQEEAASSTTHKDTRRTTQENTSPTTQLGTSPSTTAQVTIISTTTQPEIVSTTTQTESAAIQSTQTDATSRSTTWTIVPSRRTTTKQNTVYTSPAAPTEEITNVVTAQTTKAPAEVVTTTVQCTGGFVQCRDGRCEPFESLCEEVGVVTMFPGTRITHTTTSVPSSGMTDKSTMVTSSKMAPLTDLVTDPTIAAVTDDVTELVTDGVCKPGFVKCLNGLCEPYELLCEELGSVTIETVSPPTIVTTDVATTTDSVTTDQSRTENMIGVSSLQTGTPGSVSIVTRTVTDGVCNTGFVKCKDGRCEPFEQLCGEEGIITLPTISAIITSPIASVETNSPDVSMATEESTSTGTPGSTIPTTIATLPPLDTGCPPGYELCPDKQCEPFHFLCEEHSTGELIGLVGR